jgi:hypothetical protein
MTPYLDFFGKGPGDEESEHCDASLLTIRKMGVMVSSQRFQPTRLKMVQPRSMAVRFETTRVGYLTARRPMKVPHVAAA